MKKHNIALAFWILSAVGFVGFLGMWIITLEFKYFFIAFLFAIPFNALPKIMSSDD